MAHVNGRGNGELRTNQLTQRDGEDRVEWVRPGYFLALFIAVSWVVGMFPHSTALFEAWDMALGRMLLISATSLAYYGLLNVRNDSVLSSLSGLSVYGGILLLTLVASGLAIHSDRSAVYVPLTLLTMLVAVGFSPVLAIESYFFIFLLVSVTWIPSGEPFSVLQHTGTIPFTSDVFFLLSFIALAPGSIAAGIMCKSIRKRTRPLSAGLASGVINVFMMLGLGLLLYPGHEVIIKEEYRRILYVSSGVAFSSSLASGILLLAILPIVEKVFEMPTDLGLLELTDMNQPMLRKLAMEAPGTYHHSLRVGTLCEEAAEAIGANALLARVGSYYHDIGKTTKPQYFIENNQGRENPHDRLPSNMSKLILIGHVRDGLELADEYGLPEWVKAFIAEHHGTSVTEYFFAEQVQSQLAKGEEPDVETADFRYPGPLPRTRETGICMLADTVEATSRSLDDSSPAKIEGMVDRVVEKKLQDGQLNESGLTLGEIKTIRRTFVEVLSGMLHGRVEYPDQEKEIAPDEDHGSESTEHLQQNPRQTDENTENSGPSEDSAYTTSGAGGSAPSVSSNQDVDGKRRIFILDQQDDLSVAEKEIRELVHFVLDAEHCDRDISVVLLKKTEIQELNRQYLDEDRPTDVLAFPMSEARNEEVGTRNEEDGAKMGDTLGEVMVCPAVARSRATDMGHSPLHETYLYVIHGLLHLLDYDDKNKEDKEKMKTRQEELLESFVGTKMENTME